MVIDDENMRRLCTGSNEAVERNCRETVWELFERGQRVPGGELKLEV